MMSLYHTTYMYRCPGRKKNVQFDSGHVEGIILLPPRPSLVSAARLLAAYGIGPHWPRSALSTADKRRARPRPLLTKLQ